ncbi:MAG: DUF2791 family P-loop domain-containing protein, partial [Chloroflexota bacterium]|nr:DUF2791 family P-loop domain-containing protein [Chloroflexota bacterium]
MLVGRTHELDVLIRCLDEIGATGASTVLVTGEPGIGKTSLLATLRDAATRRGLAIASDVSNEPIRRPPGASWSSILEHLDLAPVPTSPTGDPGISPDEHRFQVSRSIVRSIRDGASSRPIVITLDDIQWMDQLSREVLAHLTAGLGSAPVLLVAAWRTPVSDRDPDFSTFVANLRRDPATRWLDVSGLDEPDVAALVTQLGQAASPTAIRRLTAETNGNPFFVSEIVRLTLDRGALGVDPGLEGVDRGIPPSIRDVVRLRFARLPERTRQVLGVAAILTHGFDFEILRELAGLDENDLLDAIDDALDSDFLRPTDRRPEHYDFTHGIVREAIAAGWSSSRRARLHRRAAETLERHFAGRHEAVAGELARHYFASRSIEGANRGIVHAIASADQASRTFDFAQAADLLTIASELAITEPLAVRADIEWRRALALAESLRIGDAVAAAERTIEMLRDADTSPEMVAHACWRMAHALNAVGADEAIRRRLQRVGLRALGDRRDIHWARLRLLSDPIEPVPNDVLFVARWAGYDAEAQRIARQSDHDEDVAQTIQSFDPRNPYQTRNLIVHARAWQQPRATLRGLTAAANDLTYRHGEFRQAMRLWHEVLTTARRIGTIPWQANALNQITLLHVTLGEFDLAVASKRMADEVNAELGPASDAEALLMERDFALTHYLDGDWPGQASYWLRFVGDPPHGLEAQLAVPLYAAMAAASASRAGIVGAHSLRLVDELADIVAFPGIQQVNGVVAWAADAVTQLGASDRAATFDRLAADIIASGVRDYPQTSLALTRARMLTLLDDPLAQRMFDGARETLAAQGQVPLLGIACYEQAIAPTTSITRRKPLLRLAIGLFESLGMTTWHERAMAAT